jgi:hypothetical protein
MVPIKIDINAENPKRRNQIELKSNKTKKQTFNNN